MAQEKASPSLRKPRSRLDEQSVALMRMLEGETGRPAQVEAHEEGWLLDASALTRFLHPVHGAALTGRLMEAAGREGLPGKMFTSALCCETLTLRALSSLYAAELGPQLRRIFLDIVPLPYERHDAEALAGFAAARGKGSDLAPLRVAAQAKTRGLTLLSAKPDLYAGLEGVLVESA